MLSLPVDVCLVTWPNHPRRIAYFQRMLDALREKLTASRHELVWHCSAESDRDPSPLVTWHGEELEDLCRRHAIELVWRMDRASLGAAMNAACRLGSSDLIFLVQDDYELLEPLDLSPGIDFMRLHHSQVDLLRYSYYQHPVYGTQFRGEIDGWRRVDIDGFWPYGDDPQLRPRDFPSRWGWYLEGGRHGASESEMLFLLVAGRATIAAAAKSYFRHFGEVSAVPIGEEYRPRAVSR